MTKKLRKVLSNLWFGTPLPPFFSEVAVEGRCPDCGGRQFVRQRSTDDKIALGVLAPRRLVRCVTCGARFRRG